MFKLPEFFDANCYIGRPTRAVHQPAATAAELLAALDHAGIRRALVWHVAQRDVHPAEGNRLLDETLGSHAANRLDRCWTILPPQTREVIDDVRAFFIRMKHAGVTALRVFPEAHRYLLRRIAFGSFLDEVCERRIPLMVSLGGDNRGWPAVYDLLQDYPSLTLVLCDIGIWGADRYTWPLLENYPNVFIESSLLALEDGGLEAMVARYGAGRILFGTGYPERYPESAVLQLLHADISEAERDQIASGNLNSLLSGARVWLE